MAYSTDIIEAAKAVIEREHREEHFDDVVMDCPICVAEWDELTGGAR